MAIPFKVVFAPNALLFVRKSMLFISSLCYCSKFIDFLPKILRGYKSPTRFRIDLIENLLECWILLS
jgi:hypothetical protein